jgi:hypothetical protein
MLGLEIAIGRLAVTYTREGRLSTPFLILVPDPPHYVAIQLTNEKRNMPTQ